MPRYVKRYRKKRPYSNDPSTMVRYKKRKAFRKARTNYKSALRNPFQNLSMLPGRLKTKCYQEFGGSIDPTSPTPLDSLVITVKGSSLHIPFTQILTYDNDRLVPIAGTWDMTTANPYGLTRMLGIGSDTNNAPYGAYRVFASKIYLEAYSGNGVDVMNVIIAPMDSNELQNEDNVRNYEFLSQAPNRVGPKMTAHDVDILRMSKYITTSKVLGLTKQAVRDNSNQSAVANANPVGYFAWVIGLFNSAGVAFDDIIRIKIRVEYWIELFDLNEVTQTVEEAA